MNPPRAPAPRCIRGRGRGGGGGAYRPYYFFKRNGRTIPAHGRGTTHPNKGRGGAATATVTTPPLPTRLNNVPPQHAALDSSFMRPQIYAAPEDVQKQVQSIAIETPFPHPGWRLYFYKEPCEANSELVKRIQFMEAHFKTYNSQYDYVRTQNTGCFELKANTLRQDVDLQQNWPTLMNDLLVSPLKTLATIGVAMHSLATSAAIETSATQQKCCKTKYFPKVVRPRKIYVRPSEFMAEGPMARISSLEIDQFYCVRGVVTEMGAVEATASWIAFKCTRCLQEQAIKQTGFNPSRPYTCKRQGCQARQGFVELRCSPFTRITPVQMIRVAEARLDVLSDDENLKTYLDIELKYDLVDTVYLGQEIIVTGSLKMRSLQEEQDYQKTTALTGKMQIFLKAASIKDAKYCKHPYTEKDEEAITMINGEQDCFKLLVHSLAPEVHGHEMVKAGALLSLIGGSGSQVHEETEINVLLVGDPGVGKSGIAQMCAKISLKGCLVQAKRGNTTTGNKLTYLLKGRSNLLLESGGLIAASNGHCSIDDIDRLAAQQEVLINVLQSKMSCMAYPSVFTTFTTPTSVIATANSMRGHYDQSKLLTENIRINTTLLTEFHLVFVMLDKPNQDMDTSLTEHIRALHAGCKKNAVIANKFDKKPKTNNSMNISIEDLETQPEEENNYDLNMRLKLSPLEELDLDLLPAILMKKFIAYSRNQVKPLFIAEAADDLRNFYNELRQQAENSQSAISSSHLAGLIRLCQARARIDFSSEVTKLHVRDIICIVKQSNADIALGDYVDTNPAITAQSQRPLGTQSNVRKFIQMLQMRSSALSRRIFDFDELKDMARRVGIQCGVTNLIDIVNLQGLLLKKGPNLYEVMMD